MQGNGVVHAPPPRAMGDGFQSRSPKAEEKTRLYSYVVVMDGVRYHVALKSGLNKTDKQANLLKMQESDFFSVSREGREIEPGVFISAYSCFSSLADSEHAHTIEIYYSVASL